MKIPLRSILVVVLVGFSRLCAQSFEGVMEIKTSSRGESPNITYMVKDGNIRMEMETQHGKAVFLHMGKDGRTIMLMEQMQMYMEFPPMPEAEGDAPKPEIS